MFEDASPVGGLSLAEVRGGAAPTSLQEEKKDGDGWGSHFQSASTSHLLSSAAGMKKKTRQEAARAATGLSVLSLPHGPWGQTVLPNSVERSSTLCNPAEPSGMKCDDPVETMW